MEAPSGAKVEVPVVSSNYHIELNPGDAGFYDYVAVQTFLKDTAQSQTLGTEGQRAFKGSPADRGRALARH